MIIFFYKNIINKVLKLYFFLVILGFYYYFIRKYFGIKIVFIMFVFNKIIFLKYVNIIYMLCVKNKFDFF